MPIVAKGIVLGLIIFTIDMLVYAICAMMYFDKTEREELSAKLKYTLPIGLFMQVFFALIFLFTFRFLAIFKALDQSVGGGLYFAYILFLPLLYMQFNNWLWLDTKRTTTFLNITAWGIKLAICGVFVAFL